MKKHIMNFAVLISILLPNAATAHGQSADCDSSNAGILHCFAGTSCMCKLFPTSLIKNDPGGYRWDCGITRPKCYEEKGPLELKGAPYEGPQAVGVDKSVETNSTVINN